MDRDNPIEVGYEPDPVIDFYKPGIDMTLVRENLKLTIDQRIDRLQAMVDAIEELKQSRHTFRPKGS